MLAAALLVAPAAQASQASPAGPAAASVQRGHISGQVTTKAGRGLAGICLQISGPEFISVQTGKSGTYRSLPLKPGRYEVHFNAGCGNTGNWAPQYYKNATTEKNERKVTVTAGHTTRNIDAVMHQGAVVTGTVTNSSGKPIPAICIAVLLPGKGQIPLVITRTSKRGFYRAERIVPGRYRVEFLARCGGNHANYAPQQWKGKTLSQQPTLVQLTAGRVTPHINARMTVGAEISGMVTEGSSSGMPLKGICVRVEGQGPLAGFDSFGTTNGDGTYFVNGLATGKYKVNFNGCADNPDNVQPETVPGVHLTTGKKTTVNGVVQPAS